jgi:hypothetical protein
LGQAEAAPDRLHIVRHVPAMQTAPGWQLSGASMHAAPTFSLCQVAQSQTVASVV